MKIRITDVHPASQFYCEKDTIIGNVYKDADISQSLQRPGWDIFYDFKNNHGMWCKYEPVEDADVLERQVTAFSELAATNKRLADDLQVLLQSAESMRDHYETMSESWKELATERAKRADKYLETLEMITMLIKGSIE